MVSSVASKRLAEISVASACDLAPTTCTIERVPFDAESVLSVVGNRFESVTRAAFRLYRKAAATISIGAALPAPPIEELLRISSASLRELVDRIATSEASQLRTMACAISGSGVWESPNIPVSLLADCEGDPHTRIGRVRGIAIDGRRLVFRPGNNLALMTFNRVAAEVFHHLGSSYGKLNISTSTDCVFVDYADKSLEKDLTDDALFAAGILVGLCELISVIDLHDQNAWLSPLGWVVADAETVLTRNTPPRSVTLFGQATAVMDSPLCSSFLPLWMKQVPSGFGFRSALLGWRMIDIDPRVDYGLDATRAYMSVRTEWDPLLEGYRSFLASKNILSIIADGMTGLIGEPVRVAARPTAEYGAYLHWYIDDCVSGRPADELLRSRLQRRAASAAQLEDEVQEIRYASIPKFERIVFASEIAALSNRLLRMRQEQRRGTALIEASLACASLNDRTRILAACRGDFDSAMLKDG